MNVSILISSHNRIELFRRTLYSINKNAPSCSFEVIVADDGSDDPIIQELEKYTFPWKFLKVDNQLFEEKTGIKHYHNCPALTNNCAFVHSIGSFIFLMGNDAIAYDDAFNILLQEHGSHDGHFITVSTTYDIPLHLLNKLDMYGTNVNDVMRSRCALNWPLASCTLHTDVTNYLSLCPRKTWAAINGYDERYCAGIAAEDSDFVRRARTLPGFRMFRSISGISFHQYHGGKTMYYNPTEIKQEKWDNGVKTNHKLYNAWDGRTTENQQSWPIGSCVTSIWSKV